MYQPLSEEDIRNLLTPHLNFPLVFLETALPDKENFKSLLFTDFKEILTFNYQDRVEDFFSKLEYFLNKGYWLSGYFNYEFGFFLEPALYNLRVNKNSLVWLGVSSAPRIINHLHHQPSYKENKLEYKLKNLEANLSYYEYQEALKKIKYFLQEGLSYQVNFSFKIKFDFEGSPLDFYLSLRRAQPTSYSAFIFTGDAFIISLSPELFFKIEKGEIISRPMKGTASRGIYNCEDKRKRQKLRRSKKIRAENIMIVDLLRNDLGRVCEKVWVPNLFTVEKYRTLYQLTSTIKGKLKEKLSWKEIFTSLFPCGSVTGAPKIKTIQIIKSLEKEQRGIYTGSIGYFSPQREACFNVAIRSIFLKNNKGELGIGGGIVYDSWEEKEYKEALLKGKFLTRRFPHLSLIETILLKEGEYFLLELHLKRLKNSASYFSIPLDLAKVKKGLEAVGSCLKRGKFKVRVLLSLEGRIRIEKAPLEEITSPVKVILSSQRINPSDTFLYHKTTQRNLYQRELKKARDEGFFEVIFSNIYGELTEGSVSNIFILKEKKLFTPPQKCGLLKGVLREYLLEKKEAEERVLFKKDILTADKVYIGNSLRGLLEAEIFEEEAVNKKFAGQLKNLKKSCSVLIKC